MIAEIKNVWLRRLAIAGYTVLAVIFQIIQHGLGCVLEAWRAIAKQVRKELLPDIKTEWQIIRDAWRGPSA